jgi:hypothetical protein
MMRILFPALLCAATVFSLQAAEKQDDITWGPVDHGLKLGVALGPATPEPQLRLVFQNLDRAECVLQLGSSSAKGAVYNVEFTLHSPDGKEFPAFNFNGPPGVQKAAKPVMVHLARGEKYEIQQSLNKLIYVDESGKNHPVPEMLTRHYSLRATVDTTGTAQWGRTRDEWMGKVTSGDLRR